MEATAYRKALRRGLVCDVRTQHASETSTGGWHPAQSMLTEWPDVLALVDTLRVKSEQEPMAISITISIKRF